MGNVKSAVFALTLMMVLEGQAFAQPAAPKALDGLRSPVRVVRDSDGVPHIFADNDRDATFMLGYVHAQDRFFQMDLLRRTFSGTLGELFGPAVLPQDIQFRTLGIRRAAEASWAAYAPPTKGLLRAYADGVNAYIGNRDHAPPPEYAALEVTKLERWSALDSVTLVKGLAFGLSFDLSDLDFTAALLTFQAAGQALGFNGGALFFEDLYRSAPFDPTVSIPSPSSSPVGDTDRNRRETWTDGARELRAMISPGSEKLIRDYLRTLREIPVLARFTERIRGNSGSNWWIVGPDRSESGYPMLANDPHLTLDVPATFYEAHLTVSHDPVSGPMNVGGVSFAGTPGIIQGCNDRVCWGSTVNPLDVTDIYLEQLVIDPSTFLPVGTRFENAVERLILIPQQYRLNRLGNGIPDDLSDAAVGPLEGGVTLVVPRRNNGPIVSADVSGFPNVTALSVQYTGWGATFETEALLRVARAGSVEDFKDILQYFDVGSQNWAYADTAGNIAYFTSAEMPIREDLQRSTVDGGIPPIFIRDGTHRLKHEWLPVQNRQPRQALNYEILPFSEMPQVINPAQGFILNANNDPVGVTLDNNSFNQVRPGGGIFYLSPGYTSLRIGTIAQAVQSRLRSGRKLSLQDMKAIQANNQLIDARVFTPSIFTALDHARAGTASQALRSLGDDPGIGEAVRRIRAWDFSTPTGIREGFDAGDDPENLPEPGDEEIRNSVAATIYSLWRSRFVANTLDATLGRVQLGRHTPPSELALSAIRNLLDNFSEGQGRGVSGLNFFEVPEVSSAQEALDLIILRSLKETLELLAGESFASAFRFSTNLGDYRWGRLHRIVFDHPLGDLFSIPSAAGFAHLSPELRGIPTDGGFGAVDASAHSARASRPSQFMFGSGPARRFVGELRPDGIEGFQIIPGGQSGNLTSPHYANQLRRWLANGYHPLRLSARQVEADKVSEETFAPPLFAPYIPWRVPK